MVGYKDDKIFLLSIEEYEQYKDTISYIPVYWWLRSPSLYRNYAAFVRGDGDVSNFGISVSYDNNAVRPALKYDSTKNTFYCFGATWDKIDDNLYIARMPITFMRFDKNSNNYETSEVRKFLLDFIK